MCYIQLPGETQLQEEGHDPSDDEESDDREDETAPRTGQGAAGQWRVRHRSDENGRISLYKVDLKVFISIDAGDKVFSIKYGLTYFQLCSFLIACEGG